MRSAAPFLASLLLSIPAAALAQNMDGPTMGAPPAETQPVGQGEGVAAAAALELPAVKTGMYVGFSFGTGTGNVDFQGSSYTLDEYFGTSPTTLAMAVRLGWYMDELLLGMQMNLIRSFADYNGASVGHDMLSFDVVATWMSRDMGMYTRVGVGPASINWFVDSDTSDSYSGMEVMLGVGFSSGGFGVGIDMIRQSYEDGTPIDSATYFLASLSLDLF